MHPIHATTAPKSELAQALSRCRHAFIGVAIVSGLINILMLTGPLFMLQVYDRVLPSHSVPTLIGLAVVTIALFSFQGVLDACRGRILLRIGGSLNEDLSDRVHDAIMRLSLKTPAKGNGLQPLRDLDQIRAFMSSQGPAALFDLPWLPLYVGICFLFHPSIGIVATSGALALIALTLLAEATTQGPASSAASFGGARRALLETTRRNAEVVQALGMGAAMSDRFRAADNDFQQSHRRVSDRASTLATLSRVMRLMLQSAVLGLGAYLVINQEATAGVIIASSILMSRALGPVELAIANWKGFVGARSSYRRLSSLLAFLPLGPELLSLPKPEQCLSVENVSATPPGGDRVVLQDISLTLNRGDGLGIIGPSASGKTSLARLIVGIWAPVRGKVRLDNAAIDQWSPTRLGRHIGYLPQDVELIDGSIAENISRFESQPAPEAIIAAAKAAGVHELIVRLPDGYDTKIGEGGAALSAGQRQRIALARALYRDPFLVVLDEPNSNLDSDGEDALIEAITGVRQRQGIVIVIAHRASALASVNHVLVLNEGRQQAFGLRDEILRPVLQPQPVPAEPASVAHAIGSAA